LGEGREEFEMRNLRQNQGETAEQWLARLHRTDQASLPPHGRRTLHLLIGYARYLIEKGSRERHTFPAGDSVDCPTILSVPPGEGWR
jgi:hypothetical protein